VEYEDETDFFVHIFHIDEKILAKTFAKLAVNENAAPPPEKISNETSVGEQLTAVEKLLVCGSVTHLLLGVDLNLSYFYTAHNYVKTQKPAKSIRGEFASSGHYVPTSNRFSLLSNLESSGCASTEGPQNYGSSMKR